MRLSQKEARDASEARDAGASIVPKRGLRLCELPGFMRIDHEMVCSCMQSVKYHADVPGKGGHAAPRTH